MNIAIIQGTRPEIIKNYSIVKALKQQGIPFNVLHTNQHYDVAMRDDVYIDMGYKPDIWLRGPYRIGLAIDWIQSVLKKTKTTHVIINGDTAASISGALAAMYLGIGISHIEAGLRSRDQFMLEERNRIMVDSIASLLFAYTDYEYDVLARSSDIRGEVFVEGNTTVDLINDFESRILEPADTSAYAFATLHRRELTDDPVKLKTVLEALSYISRRICRVYFAIHPRTKDAIRRFGLENLLSDMIISGPVGLFESLSLQKHASVVLTDSGCVQEEAYMLGTQCITLRDNTERHLTVEHGANHVSGIDWARIVQLCELAIAREPVPWPEIYGSNGAAFRILERITGGVENVTKPKEVRGKPHSKGVRLDYLALR